MNFFYLLHLIIIVFMISIMFMPINVIEYIYLLPLIFPILWEICGGCPLNNLHKNDNEHNSILYDIYKNIFKDITYEQSESLTYTVLILIVSVCSYRIISFKNKEISELKKIKIINL